MKVEKELQNKIVIYTDKNGNVELKADIEKETIWASLDQIAKLFGRDKSVVSRHIKNIFDEAELDRDSVVAKNATTATDGKTYMVEYYNLDAIIAVGYRVNSKKATQFRIWATRTLRSYLVRGFVENIVRIKELPDKIIEDLEQTIKTIQETIQKIKSNT